MPLMLSVAAALILVLGSPPSRADTLPAPGTFLVADESMPDARFQETVVLVITHDANGTLGLIINRPTDIAVHDAIANLPEPGSSEHRIHYGGPVEVSRTLFLLRGEGINDDEPVFADVYMSSRRSALIAALADRGTDELRVYAGYSGWGAGQLDAELANDGWQVVAADADTVFSDDPDAIWRSLYRPASDGLFVDIPAPPFAIIGPTVTAGGG